MNVFRKGGALLLSIGLLPLLIGADGGSCGAPVTIGGDDPAAGKGGGGGAGGKGDGGGGASSGGGKGAMGCDEFSDQVSSWRLAVAVRNERADAIYLGQPVGCATPIIFSVYKEGGSDLLGASDTLEPERNRHETCTVAGGLLSDCTTMPVIRIEPGGYYKGVWSGLVYDRVMPPASCDLPGVHGGACDRARVAPASTYRIESTAYLAASGCAAGACTCPAGSPGGSCVPRGDGSVLSVTGSPIQATTSVDVPSSLDAEVVFR